MIGEAAAVRSEQKCRSGAGSKAAGGSTKRAEETRKHWKEQQALIAQLQPKQRRTDHGGGRRQTPVRAPPKECLPSKGEAQASLPTDLDHTTIIRLTGQRASIRLNAGRPCGWENSR